VTEPDSTLFERARQRVADPTTPWPEVVTWLEALTEQARRSPEYQRERDWYLTNMGLDPDEILATPEGRQAFQAGMRYVQCQQETAP
jgi:hypothetical protein